LRKRKDSTKSSKKEREKGGHISRGQGKWSGKGFEGRKKGFSSRGKPKNFPERKR